MTSDAVVPPPARWRTLLIVFGAYLVVLLLSMPASPWEFDEPLFFQALHRYDPVAHHPPPPGYPVFIGAGQLVRAFVPSDFAALLAISVVSSAIGFLMLALAFRNFAGDLTVGIAGAVLFYFSPAMLVHASLPISEPGALAILATALYFGSRGSWPALFATFAALAVGWRIQFAIFIVPLFLVALPLMRRWRDRAVALVVFTAVCLAWLMPLAMAVGGLEELVAFETGQGKYLAAHDADQSRSGWTSAMVATRFIAHPWGVKIASIPVLMAAAAGFVVAMMNRWRPVIPMIIAAAVYITFALRVMDPADGVRYAIPFVLVTAFFAANGAVAAARRFGLPQSVLPALFCAGAIIYVSSFLSQRSTTTSPPVRAAQFALRNYPKNAVAIYELPLWPHATYYLRQFTPRRFDDAMALYYDRPDVPMFIYADGAARAPGAATFSWEPSDAYSKLTRNHYRVASIIPAPPQTRFRAVRGIYGPEREPEGLAWRWFARVAELQLPRGGPRHVTLRFSLPDDAPVESNELAVAIDGTAAGTHRVARGRITAFEVAVPEGSPRLTFTAAHWFVPAEVPGSLSRDRRRLAVKHHGLTARTVGADEAPEGASRSPAQRSEIRQ